MDTMKGVFLGNMHVVVVHTEEPRLCDRAILGMHATPCSASGHGLVKLLELERKAMYLRGFPRSHAIKALGQARDVLVRRF